MNKRIFLFTVILMILSVSLAVVRLLTPEDTWLCQNNQWVKHGNPSSPAPTSGCGEVRVNQPVGLANPASQYCVDQGGSLDIRSDEQGNQTGWCRFDSGRECEEWAFFRGECSDEEVTVQIFLNNDILDAETSCVSVFPLERKVTKDQNIMRSTLEELLKGPTDQEKQQHYFTSINSDVVLNSLTVENGVVRADFNRRIEEGGGSCWVTSIRAEITQTLMQFPEVREVIISVEGRVEDALQP